MNVHLDSVLTQMNNKQQDWAELQSRILNPETVEKLNIQIEQSLKKMQLNNKELQEKLQYLNEERLRELEKVLENLENAKINHQDRKK